MVSGIYFIIHGKSMKRYIGQAKDLDRRLEQHWKKLSNNKHENSHLQRAYNKYGRDAFFVASTPCAIDDLNEREQYFIDTMWDMSYNICKAAGKPPGFKGRKHSEEHKAKVSAIHKGKTVSAETRAKLSAVHKGKKKAPRTAEHRANLSASRKGKKYKQSDSHKA